MIVVILIVLVLMGRLQCRGWLAGWQDWAFLRRSIRREFPGRKPALSNAASL